MPLMVPLSPPTLFAESLVCAKGDGCLHLFAIYILSQCWQRGGVENSRQQACAPGKIPHAMDGGILWSTGGRQVPHHPFWECDDDVGGGEDECTNQMTDAHTRPQIHALRP